MNDVRNWYHYPIIMPLNKEGEGPATVGVDAHSVVFEVWDGLHDTHGTFEYLEDAINKAMALNETVEKTDDT